MVNYVYRNKIKGNTKERIKMRKFHSVPCDLYILKSDLPIIDSGEEVEAYITVNNLNDYELINKHAFQPAIKVNENTFLVTWIFK
jgi:hypothetical protein